MMKGPNRSDLFLTILLFTSVGRNLSLSSGENISVDGKHFRMYSIQRSDIPITGGGGGVGGGNNRTEIKETPLQYRDTCVSAGIHKRGGDEYYIHCPKDN